ncbi:unnamed protein product [Anisakis simplex]|uniref:Electron transporter RnfG n=1 Tax=Anisakis simplex TaxID=6269 RepID=A0A0M3JP56_ANISI|nr:unnamed protein product [Anisakis simplex]
MQRNRWLLVLWYGVSVLLFIAGCVTLAMGSVRLAAETRVEGLRISTFH